MKKVRVEFLSWIVEAVNTEENRHEVVFEHEINEGSTVRHVLNQLAQRYPRFGQIVFDVNAQRLNESVWILFNGGNLMLANGLDTRLKEGDLLAILPVIEGG